LLASLGVPTQIGATRCKSYHLDWSTIW